MVGGVVIAAAVVLRHRVVSVGRYFWQGARPWGPMQLGNGGTSIADGGCALVSFTHASNALYGADLDPVDANALVLDAGGFSGSLLVFPTAAAALGLRAPDSERIHARSGASVDELAARIDHALSGGGVAVVNVDRSYGGQGAHFVLVTGRRGGDFVAIDPAGDGDVNPFEITIDRATLTASSTWNRHPVVVGVAPVYRGAA